MIVVRTAMQCKWGRVDEVLANTKASYERMQGQATAIKRVRVLAVGCVCFRQMGMSPQAIDRFTVALRQGDSSAAVADRLPNPAIQGEKQ